MSRVIGLYGFGPLWCQASAETHARSLLDENAIIQHEDGITFATAHEAHMHRNADFIICAYNTNDYTTWHNVKTSHDIENRLRAYDIHNADVILWNKKQKTLSLASSPTGHTTLFIGWVGSTLILSDCLKTITKHTDFQPDINRNALTSYMRFGYVPAPLCIYKNIIQIPPGYMMHIDMTLLRSGQDLHPFLSWFWTLSLPQETPDLLDKIVQLKKHIQCALTNTLEKHDHFAIHLNNTPSTYIIAAIAQNIAPEKVKRYTVTDKEHISNTHTNIITKPNDIPKFVEHMVSQTPQPLALIHALHDSITMQHVGEDVRLLSTQSASALFGDHQYYNDAHNVLDMINTPKPSRILIQRIKAIPQLGEHFWQKLKFCFPDLNTPIRELPELLHKETRGDIYLHYISHWQKPKKLVLDGHEETLPLTNSDFQIDADSFYDEMIHWDMLRLCGAQNIGNHTHSIPIIDSTLFKHMQTIPVSMKVKTILSHLAKEYKATPPDNIQALSHNDIGTWLRHELKDWAEDLLDPYELRAQNLLNIHHIQTIWIEHQSGHINHTKKLWALLMFQAWHRHWIAG